MSSFASKPQTLWVYSFGKNEEGFSYVFPSEAKSLPLPSSRIVDRKPVAMSGFYPPRSAENDAIRGKDSNFGNFLWQYASTRMIKHSEGQPAPEYGRQVYYSPPVSLYYCHSKFTPFV